MDVDVDPGGFRILSRLLSRTRPHLEQGVEEKAENREKRRKLTYIIDRVQPLRLASFAEVPFQGPGMASPAKSAPEEQPVARVPSVAGKNKTRAKQSCIPCRTRKVKVGGHDRISRPARNPADPVEYYTVRSNKTMSLLLCPRASFRV